MDIERIGHLGYKLYRLGWRSAIDGDRASLGHLFLSVFLYYRRGFMSGAAWAKEHHPPEELYS